jgi:lipopolysaccharide export system permease protein
MISLFDRYLFREWLKAMLVFLWLTLGILFLEDMYKNSKMFIDREVPLVTVGGYYGALLPHFLCTAVPLSFFLSLLFVLNALHGHNEIVAMRASGWTVFRITRILWVTAGVLVGAMVFFNARILPWASEKVQTILEIIEFNHQKKEGRSDGEVGKISHINFYHWEKNRLWFISDFSLYSHRGKQAMVSQLNDRGQECGRIQAREVCFDEVRREWIFRRGVEWKFDADEPIGYQYFDEKQMTDFTETPGLMDGVAKPVKYLTFKELKAIRQEFPKSHKSLAGYHVRYYSILSTPFVCLVGVLLAVPFSLSGVRSNPIVGVSEAVGLFFLYYLFSHLGDLFGTQGFLSPFVAAWIPNFFMLLLGGEFYRRLAPR